MAGPIVHTVTLPAPPRRLFDVYMTSAEHAAAIGSTARVSRRVGGAFSAFDGMLRGRMLAIVPGRTIVQTWRGSDWTKSEPDSILVLTFEKSGRGGRIALVHANIPARHRAGISKGWHEYYWRRWRKYLTRARRRRR